MISNLKYLIISLIFSIGILLISNGNISSFIYAQMDKETNINSQIISKTNEKYFNIAVASDWGCNPYAKETSKNIQNHNPELVIIAGDLSYKPTGDCWFKQILPFASKIKLALGDHDYDDTLGGKKEVIKQYLEPFKITKTYYSIDLNNVHVVFMDPYIDYVPGTAQHQFIEKDLKKAFTNPNVDWTIVVEPVPIFTSPSKHPADLSIRTIYQPLFDKYGVDLVLSGDNHNYQRTFPLKYDKNGVNAEQPVISNKNKNKYSVDDGVIYIITGTAGRNLYNLTGQSQFVSTQDDQHHGFLNIEINGQSLKGTFIANPLPEVGGISIDKTKSNNKLILDEFSISIGNNKELDKNSKLL